MEQERTKKSNNVRNRAYDFSLEIINFVKDFPHTKMYLIFADQLMRSATFVGANLVEAKSSTSRKDFARYYEIALRSANETGYWLNLLKDAELVDCEKILLLGGECQEISKMICASLKTIRKTA